MLPRRGLGAWLHLLALWFLLIRCSAARDEPSVKKTGFKGQLSEILYFDDSDVVLVTETVEGVVHRSNDGGIEWKAVADIPNGKVVKIVMNPHHNKIAIALGREKEHWITKDQGKSWKSFKTEYNQHMEFPAFSFHADDADSIIMNTGDNYESMAIYTTSGFEKAQTLRKKAYQCLWAREQDRMETGSTKSNEKRSLCLVEGKYSSDPAAKRLVISDDYFEEEFEPDMAKGEQVTGFSRMAAVKGYIVAAQKAKNSAEMAFYVSTDTKSWHLANFGNQKIEENAFTVLESTNYSLQVDVMVVKPDLHAENQMGYLFTSDSNGTYFTRNAKYTNRDQRGFVDFEKVQNIQGILIINVVDNAEDVLRAGDAKKIISQISFDDGRTMEHLRADGDDLHLHSVTDQRNSGRIFSSPAPGIVMGVGNTGKFLLPYEQGDTYVSDDAGMTWNLALKGAHKYEFGDSGSVLVAIDDEGETKEFKYSLNHGKDWTKVDLPTDDAVRARVLTTVPDSTSIKFLIMATKGKGFDTSHVMFSVDFDGLHERECERDDFETWVARANKENEGRCIMGHTQTFRRRKANADCFVKKEWADPRAETDRCDCKEQDFECDWGFVPSDDGKGCNLDSSRLDPGSGQCSNDKEDYSGPSGYRMIPGDDCRRKDGKQPDDEIKRPCSKSPTSPPSKGDKDGISVKMTDFDGAGAIEDSYYLNDCIKKGKDDCGDLRKDGTIIALTSKNQVYISTDHGKRWSQPKELEDEKIMAIYPHQYNPNRVFLLTPNNKVFVSKNRGNVWSSFEAPEPANRQRIQVLRFHPKFDDWLIWTGERDGNTIARYSTKNGDKDSWNLLLKGVQSCEFVWRPDGKQEDDKLVFCEQMLEEEPGKRRLVSSTDWFERETVLFDDMIRFATMAEYVIVALRKEDDRQFLSLKTSTDGKTFADAKFPHNFNPDHQTAYTALDSSTHAIFLHVTTNNEEYQEYGNIVKSNSNGTSYVLSIDSVNRNSLGYVDFEKMLGLEGVAMVNVVANAGDIKAGRKKDLKSMITHNDGADWAYIPPPKKDADGKDYDCSSKIEKCSLHLHAFTERPDPRDTFSSPSAIGLMIGVGNVGEYLESKDDANTFITRDGGVTWDEVMKGRFQYEYGDMGSIIVLVEEMRDTKSLFYSNDEGRTWKEFVFTERAIRIIDITTVPSDSSRNFLLWAKDGNKAVTFNIDFTGQTDKPCKLDDSKPQQGDYELWEPKHPKQTTNCLFGHVARYFRKRPNVLCYNEPNFQKLRSYHKIKENCTCTRQDFECDFNFERQKNGECKLVAGLTPKKDDAICEEDPNTVEWTKITGYRKIPMDTCEGGKEMDHVGATHPCPGHERDYVKKHGISRVGLFFSILIPLSIAMGVGYWAWRRYESGKLGQIRLGDATPSFNQDSRWVTYPVMAVSAVVAAVLAIPIVIRSIYRFGRDRLGRGRGFASRPYTSRGSFARGRGIYTPVSNDESDLLGEDSDDD